MRTVDEKKAIGLNLPPSEMSRASKDASSWWLPGYATLLVAGFLVYGAIWVIAPVKSVIPVDSEATWALVRYNALLLLGIAVGQGRSSPADDSHRYGWSDFQLRSLGVLNAVLMIASTGVVLRLVDRLVLRPQLVGNNIDTVAASATFVGAVASLLYPVGIAALPLAMALQAPVSRSRRILCNILFVFPAIDVLLVGKRGVAVILVVMYVSLIVFSGRRDILRLLIRVTALVAVASYAFALVFARRIAAYGFDLCHSLYNSKYAYTVTPKGLAEQSCAQSAHWWDTPVQVATNFAMYILHGSHEFALALPTYFTQAHWTWGATTFHVLQKPLCMVSHSASCDPVSVSPTRTGVYTTFWGPIVQDFGPATEIACLAFGLVLALVHRRARQTFAWFPLYLYFAVVVFLSPVVNLIQSGLGVYVMVGMIVFAVVYQRHGRSTS